jgi:lipoate-protein ligase A
MIKNVYEVNARTLGEKPLPTTWRLIDYSPTDPSMNLAVNEAIFRSRRENFTADTLRLWQSQNPIVIQGSGFHINDVNQEACLNYGVKIVRAASLLGSVL